MGRVLVRSGPPACIPEPRDVRAAMKGRASPEAVWEAVEAIEGSSG